MPATWSESIDNCQYILMNVSRGLRAHMCVGVWMGV